MPTSSVLTDDYVYCNMCTRKYNENAYSKHLPTCERRTKEAMLKNKVNVGNVKTIPMSSGNSSRPNFNTKFNKK